MSEAGDKGAHRGTQPPGKRQPFLVVLVGNPNSGKTTLFNALTGLRGKVGNYPGVTVERREGRLQGTSAECPVAVLDLPGSYSLSPQSLDERIVREVLLHHLAEVPRPQLVVVVLDASNLERNLYFATQVLELGHPTLIALNMVDVARQGGVLVDRDKLAQQLGTPVFPIIASTREGVPALREKILSLAMAGPQSAASACFCSLPEALDSERAELAAKLERTWPERRSVAGAEALLLLTEAKDLSEHEARLPAFVRESIQAARARLEAAGLDWRVIPIEARYAQAARIYQEAVTEKGWEGATFSDRLDRVLTHRLWGPLALIAVLGLMFQCIFAFAKAPMHLLEALVGRVGGLVDRLLPPGDLHSLLTDGVVAGVGGVAVFLPQIFLLFLFIALLEDSGYMARAAFLLDRLMGKVGLHGKSFVALLSSFACAVPAVLATRTLENPKDRLATMLVAPLMSCSARLPVYTLLIAACIPDRKVFGLFQLSGLMLLGMYLLGIVLALAMAWVFKKTLFRGPQPMLILELPAYKRPTAATALRHAWDQSKLFLAKAGTVILGINILLWFLASYPRDAASERQFQVAKQQLRAGDGSHLTPVELQARLKRMEEAHATARLADSFAGRMGKSIEPVLAPLGFDWKIGVGIVTSFAAREVFVSTMAVLYSVGEGGNHEPEVGSLAEVMRRQRRLDGRLLYTPLTGVSLMVFYVVALQCSSTVVMVRKETGGWKWPLLQWAYLGTLAWVLSFLTYQGGRLLGLG